MYLSKEEKEEFKAYSQEFLGSSGRWQKMLNEGIRELRTRKVMEVVPGENGGPETTKAVEIPVLTANGAKEYYQRYFTVETLREFFLEIKRKRDEFIANYKKQQEDAERKRKLEEELTGSAL